MAVDVSSVTSGHLPALGRPWKLKDNKEVLETPFHYGRVGTRAGVTAWRGRSRVISYIGVPNTTGVTLMSTNTNGPK